MKDYFSSHAKVYAAFRPTYPDELYQFILEHVARKNVAWDCATGNGQVAYVLAKYFTKVYATDISQSQLDHAKPCDNIHYSVGKAETTSFPDHHFDLITVGQAMHWFNLPEFYTEAKRILRTDGLVAVWGYANLTVDDQIDQHFSHFYNNIVGPYWDEARRLVESEYATLPFPFDEIKTPRFKIEVEWSFDQFAGYLTSWSATQKYIRTHQHNPVDDIMKEIGRLWKKSDSKRVTFPVFVRLGRNQKF